MRKYLVTFHVLLLAAFLICLAPVVLLFYVISQVETSPLLFFPVGIAQIGLYALACRSVYCWAMRKIKVSNP